MRYMKECDYTGPQAIFLVLRQTADVMTLRNWKNGGGQENPLIASIIIMMGSWNKCVGIKWL